MTADEHEDAKRMDLEVKRSEEALRQLNADLEQRVAEQIAEIRRQNKALKAERHRLYNVLDTLPVYVILLSEDYHVPFANRFFRERFGESGGKRCFEYLFQRTEPCENCETFKVFKTGAPHHWEWTGPDCRDYDIYDYPFTDADGASLVLEMGMDITDMKASRAALAEMNRTLEQRVARRTAELASAKREWERTFDSVSHLIAILDTDHRIVRANSAMAEFLGKKTSSECAGLKCHEAMHGCGSPIESCPYALTLADGLDHSLEVHDARLNADFLITTSPLRDEDGRMIGAVHIASDITGQKRNEELKSEALALELASRTAVDILESMGEGVLLLDMSGRIVSVNPALERMTGIPAGASLGRPVRDLFPMILSAEDQGVALSALDAALGGELRTLPALTIRSTDGRNVPVVPSLAFVSDQEDRLKAIVVTLRDISEIRAVQESLEASNELLEKIFDDTHLAIAYLDPACNFVRVNRTYAAMGGKDVAFYVGKNHFDLYPHAKNEVIFRRVAETGERFEVLEKPFEYPDQPERGATWWDWSLQAVKDKHGRVEGLLLCLLDVTRRVRARQSLVASERKYRELVENAGSIIMRITPDQKITFFNEYAQQFFGFQGDEALGRSVVGTIVPETDSEGRDLREMVREVMAHPELYANNENENMCKDGRRVWVHWANKPVRNEEGNVVEFLCVGTDITRRREIEAEALRYQQRLRDLAERLSTVEEEDRWRISRYIHDTIVQNLSLSSIHLGSMVKPLDEADLDDESDKLRRVQALLDQAIEECRMVMSDLTPALLYELGLIPALHDLARQLEEKHGTQIVVEDDGRDKPLSPPLRGFLFESVRELIMNALKHAGPCELRVLADCLDGALTIRVVDNGKGFDAARTTAHNDRHGGFGLFNIHQRLEGMGGRLDIESAPGKGTSATITLPLSAPV